MNKKVTMQTIADELHTSKNTVSQALSGKPTVSEETRQKVFECARRLGYEYQSKQPATRNGYVGLVASEHVIKNSGFFTDIYLGIEKEIKARGRLLLVHTIENWEISQRIMPPFVENNSVDALIVLSQLDLHYLQKLSESPIPCILVDHHHPLVEMDCVLTNNRYGAYEAVTYLLSLGHREIGFIGSIGQSPSYQERYEGYLMCLQEHGIKPHPQQSLTLHSHQEVEFSDFLDGLDKMPTAWFCANDMSAFLLMQSLNKRGIAVPRDISICGFDDIPLASMCHPTLTTMRINRTHFCQRIAEKLFWRLEHNDMALEEILLPAKLIIRESTNKFNA